MESFDEGDSRSAEESLRRKCSAALIFSVIAAVCSFACLILLVLSIARKPMRVGSELDTLYREQQEKLDELESERQQLMDRLDELSREKEGLESKLEYTDSLEGLLQYARDNLGYVFPDDTEPAGHGG